MKAWEMERDLMKNSKPRILSKEEQTWDVMEVLEKQDDDKLKLLWHSNVPGSGADERVIIGAIQSVESMGRNVESAEMLIPLGIKALEENDMETLNIITCRVLNSLTNAPKDDNSPYWKYKVYDSWEDYVKEIELSQTVSYDVDSSDYRDRVMAGWVAQICGGALGTAIEGYTTENLYKTFGEIKGYVREPNTFNDDITYELAFLKAFEEKGYSLTSTDIALQWAALIPFGWSAEDIALRNLKLGIFPPESGYLNNPFREWIGAQMRGAICGMVAPGNPVEAARLAWLDGEISHHNNGILGEVFNAVLVSLAFVENDIRVIVERTISMIPDDSEYYTVVRYALDACRAHDTWQDAWKLCEKKYEVYNWIHAYPNAAAEVVALWFGEGDFNKTMHIIAMEGQDVDCNAAQIGTAIGIIKGMENIDEHWTKPIGDKLTTYVRGMKHMTIKQLVDWTVSCVRDAKRV